MVAIHQPATECDTICLIIEFLRIDIIELLQLAVLKDLCVKCCHTIDGIAVVDIHMCHMHQVVAVNDRNGFLRIFSLNLLIQLFDNRNKMRNNLFQIAHWPFLKCLCKDRMIGISTNLCNDIACFLKVNAFCSQQTDELRNDHTWMCIVDLYNCVISQVMKVASFGHCLVQDQLCSIAYHKVLLIDTKLSSVIITVIRIQEQSQVMKYVFFIECNTIMNHALICNINIK